MQSETWPDAFLALDLKRNVPSGGASDERSSPGAVALAVRVTSVGFVVVTSAALLAEADPYLPSLAVFLQYPAECLVLHCLHVSRWGHSLVQCRTRASGAFSRPSG
jgi:hypothetical protein